MKKQLTRNVLLIIAVGLVALILGISAKNIIAGNGYTQPTGNAAVTTQPASQQAGGEVQKATLSMDGYTYIISPQPLKAGVPVEMTVDLNTVYGCMRDIRIPAFGVSKYISTGNNIIRFTPDKAGTFNIACSMNMGRGTFQVADAGGSTGGYVEQATAPATGGTCGGGGGFGSSGGGCGCGMRG